ncbi:class I SAM-dependent DNA methyltransferase [Nonomuraea sp. NPDC050547]
MEYFDQRYSAESDPFLFEQRWYEERKRKVTFACLPDRRYETAFEAGCAPGFHTIELARRCDRVLAADFSAPGLARSQERYRVHATTEELGSVDFQRLLLPQQWPDGQFDLILVAEMLYYLEVALYNEFVERTVRSLKPGGVLVLVHWTPRQKMTLDVPDHHRGFAAHEDLVALCQHREQFILDVFGRGGQEAFRTRSGLFAEPEIAAARAERKRVRDAAE